MELVALVKQNSIFQPVKGENKRERRSTSSGKSKHRVTKMLWEEKESKISLTF